MISCFVNEFSVPSSTNTFIEEMRSLKDVIELWQLFRVKPIMMELMAKMSFEGK